MLFRSGIRAEVIAAYRTQKGPLSKRAFNREENNRYFSW